MGDDEARAPVETTRARCRNCGEPLRGPFCHRCGQSRKELHRSLRALVAELAGDLWGYDSRLLRTLRVLLFQPGRLSLEFLRGRRVRYVGPIRLYLLSALLYFALFAVVESHFVQIQIGANQGGEETSHGPMVIGPSSAEDGPGAPAEVSRLERGAQKMAAERGRFDRLFVAQVPRAFFLLVPVYALLLRLAFRSSGLYYAEQLVVSFHLHSFAFVLFSAVHVLGALPRPPKVVELPIVGGLALWGVVYLWRALRRIEGLSVWQTLWRLVLVSGLYVLSIGGAVGLLVVGIFWWAGGG
jgi:hypothetical protein